MVAQSGDVDCKSKNRRFWIRKNAELSALEAQIDPHFLYNTLDTNQLEGD